MNDLESKAIQCFEILFHKKENREHMAIAFATGNRFFGHYYQPRLLSLTESKQLISSRLNSLDKSDQLFFLDHLVELVHETVENQVNDYTKESIGLDLVDKWEDLSKDLLEWLIKLQLPSPNEEYKGDEDFKSFEDIFVYKENAAIIWEMIQNIEPPLLQDGVYVSKQKGSITALKEALTGIAYNGEKVSLLKRGVNDSVFSTVINNQIPGLEVSDRTLRELGTRQYNSYHSSFSESINRLIRSRKIKI